MSLIFDIGFNNGEFVEACNKIYPDHTVVSAEANISLCFRARKKNFKNFKLINYLVCEIDNSVRQLHIDINQDGISTASEEFMKNSRFSKGSKYLKENNSNWSHVVDVPTVTLDKMIEKYGKPKILKIDVEGYEYQVLLGLSQKVGKICFECHEEEKNKINMCIEHLIKLGYKEFGFIGFLDEGDIYENLTYSQSGDPYLVEPDKYVSWKLLKDDLEDSFDTERRVNYGMLWCK